MKAWTIVGFGVVLASLPLSGWAETVMEPSASVPREAMALGDRIQHDRVMVVSEGPEPGFLRVRGALGPAYDMRLPAGTIVGGAPKFVPGDLVRVERPKHGPVRVQVLRPSWKELASPEQ